jgi:hypothetical protein
MILLAYHLQYRAFFWQKQAPRLASGKHKSSYCILSNFRIFCIHHPENHPATQPHPDSMIEKGGEDE